MQFKFNLSDFFVSIIGAAFLFSFTPPHSSVAKDNDQPQKIQVAILLDVSNSMDGLIGQAKAQLWNMVSVMGKAQCANNNPPKIEIALYEYGRSTNDPKLGYVKQINSFISDLDSLSQNLFSLTTNGGDEYCGHVIYSSLNELNWDPSPDNYKVIFISGNEDFLQGDILYTKSCSLAAQKGVIVNTIYCGDRIQGIREHWNLNAECGNGSFTNINQDAKNDEIPTPYDSLLFSMNDQLNGTYLWYGYAGRDKLALQSAVDQKNGAAGIGVLAKRVAVKGKKELYDNSTWDIVDARNHDSLFINKLDRKTLPDSLKKKTNPELEKIVQEKNKQRSSAQDEINKLNTQREAFITAEKARRATIKNENTLETEVEKTIKFQAKRFRMIIQ